VTVCIKRHPSPHLRAGSDDDKRNLLCSDMESGLSISTAPQSKFPTSLLQLLSNTLVLYQTVPYLPVSSVLALGSTSKSFHALIHRTPHVFRRLDLSQVKYARSEIGSLDHGGEVWRNIQVDENVTEDELVNPCTKDSYIEIITVSTEVP